MRLKRLTVLLLTLVLLCTWLPLSVHGENSLQDSMTGEIAFAGTITDYLINPLYDGLTLDHFPALQQYLLEAEHASPADSAETYLIYSTTLESAAAKMRDAMIDRQETITIGITNKLYNTLAEMSDSAFKSLFYAAYAHDPAVPEGGDYIRFTYGGWSASGSSTSSGVKMEYSMQYYTTAEEEQQVTEQIDRLVTVWKKRNLSPYEQICTIYDYITEHVTYDNEGLKAFNTAKNNGTLTMDHCKIFTAYGALTGGTSVCQGYTNLFYRLALEMGLDARIIKSISAENHVWNIAELDGLYYNLDATWDAGEKENGYRYFLKNMEDFVNHTRNNEYGADFEAAYPMAPVSYGAEPEPAAVPGDLNEDGIVSGKDLLILRYVLADAWDKAYNAAAADVTGDGAANGADVILLRQYLAEWNVILGGQPQNR